MKHNIAKKCLIILVIFMILSSLIRIPISKADVTSHVSSITKKTFAEYKQNDFPETNLSYGGTLDRNGCALTMVANIANGYGKNVTPSDVNHAYPSGFGIRVALKDYTGQDVSPLSSLSEDTVIKKMKEGDVIWISWKSREHHSCVVDLDETSKKVYVINSYRGETLNGWQSISQVISECNGSFIKSDGMVYTSELSGGSETTGNVLYTSTSFNSASHIVNNNRSGYKINLNIDNEVDELLNNIDKKESGLTDFLSNKNRKEYLKDFIKAEIVTQYPDLRNETEITNDNTYEKVKEKMSLILPDILKNISRVGQLSSSILTDEEIEKKPIKYQSYKTNVEKGQMDPAEEYVRNRITNTSVQKKILGIIESGNISQSKVHEVFGRYIIKNSIYDNDLVEKYYLEYINRAIEALNINVENFDKFFTHQLKPTVTNLNEEEQKNELQGCIKVKRVANPGEEEDSSESYFMSYKPLGEYEKLLQNYEASGDETFKHYFSLDSSGNLVVATGNVKQIFNNRTHEYEYYYIAKRTNINYLSQVCNYTIPFEMLWTLLIYTQDEEFVHNLALQAINSDIVISVFENTSNTISTEVRNTKGYREKEVKITYTNESGEKREETTKQQEEYEIPQVFTINYTTNNAQAMITYADTWIATYTYAITKKESSSENEYTSQDSDEIKKENAKEHNEEASTISDEQKEKIINKIIGRDGSTYLKKQVIKQYINELQVGQTIPGLPFLLDSDTIDTLKVNTNVQDIFLGIASDSAFNGLEGTFRQRLKEELTTYNGFNVEQQRSLEMIVALAKEARNKYHLNNDEDFKKHIPDSYIESITGEVIVRNWNDATKIKVNETTQKIEYITSNGTVKSKIEKDSNKDNFVTLLSSHAKGRGNLESIESWMFESMESNEYVSNMTDLMKYLLQQVYGIDLGVKEFDFSIFDPKNMKGINGTSGANASSGTSALSEFLKSWENDPLRKYMSGEITDYNYSIYINQCVTQDKKYYIMCDDIGTGNNNRNYGYGICFYTPGGGFMNQQYFTEEGVNIEDPKYQNYGSSKLEVEIVDRIKEKIIEDKRDEVRKTAIDIGVSLEDYQVDALAACRYQGWTIRNFLNAYKQNGMNESIRGSCTGMGSSNKRYIANWKLFSTGKYTDPDGKEIIVSNSSVSGGSIIECAERIHSYMEQYKYTYSLNVGELAQTFEESKKYKVTCCATYVSWVLREAGYINETIHSAPGLASTLENKYNFKRVSASELQAGDVMVTSGHVQLYAGNGQIYNAGYTGAIQRANPYTSSSAGYYGLRAP